MFTNIDSPNEKQTRTCKPLLHMRMGSHCALYGEYNELGYSVSFGLHYAQKLVRGTNTYKKNMSRFVQTVFSDKYSVRWIIKQTHTGKQTHRHMACKHKHMHARRLTNTQTHASPQTLTLNHTRTNLETYRILRVQHDGFLCIL